MFIRIEVQRKNQTLHQTWEFTVIDHSLYLDKYRLDEVIPPKRKGENIDYYNRLSDRDSNLHLDNVPLPEDVKEEALKQYISKITVKKWDRN